MVFFASLATEPTSAQPRPPADRTDFQAALIRYAGGNYNPRPHGLPRFAWEIRKRTSIQAALDTAAVDPGEPMLFDYPLLVWQGDAAFPPLPERAVLNLRQHLTHGGTVLVDVSDAQVRGPFHTSVLRELARIFPEQALTRVPAAHVVYKSFYLIDRHGGRVPAQPHLDGLYVADRLAVIVSLNDLAGAMSR
ncbi:MAG: DUF4159 domain-containing protein, partial [Deltaproteobacteria bacterium]|nr:DUF4159 domain-containing protein [Deltaproteobacteria bacterium]